MKYNEDLRAAIIVGAAAIVAVTSDAVVGVAAAAVKSSTGQDGQIQPCKYLFRNNRFLTNI